MLSGSDLYGDLPIFPMLYASPSRPITEDRIERVVERLVDRAYAQFLAGKATQSQYDAWMAALDRWANTQYAGAGA